jgi:hypothetical protein
LGGLVTPGLKGVKHLCDLVEPKKIIAVHDEDKHAKGLVTKFAKVTKPESEKSLLEKSWLNDRYLIVNHYDRIEI